MKIYVVTHKKFNTNLPDIYVPIVAGADEYPSDTFPEYILDNTNDNISSEHYRYSEYTAVYWMWKNTKDEIIGENQYRRFFIKGSWYTYLKCQNNVQLLNKYILDEDYINKIFSKGYNCILPKKWAHFNSNMYQFYCNAREDGPILFSFIEDIIRNKYPEYLQDYKKMLKGRVNYFKCINVMKRELFNDMCEWLFSIYDALDCIDFDYKEREFAYLGEWLINVWIGHGIRIGKVKVKECFFINAECTLGQHTYKPSEVIFPIPLSYLYYLLKKPINIIKRLVKGK